MNRFKLLALFLFPLLTACGNSKYITVNELHNKLAHNEAVLVIDTRTSYEFNQGHIKNAKHIPFWKTPFINEKTLNCDNKQW